MKKTLFYFFVVATVFVAILLIFTPVYQPKMTQEEQPTTKYGAFLATQHAIYVNDFKAASDFADVFSDVSYTVPHRTYCLAEFFISFIDIAFYSKEICRFIQTI